LIQTRLSREISRQDASAPIPRALGSIVFFSLLLLIALTAIPYGTAEAWWKAFFVCAVFAITIIWLIEGYLSRSWINDGWSLILPIAAFAVFSFIQTLSFTKSGVQPGAIAFPIWTTISLDPYQTRFFMAQLLALLLAGIFLLRYVSTQARLRTLINVVIGVAVTSAIFGILRQTAQHQLGFALPLLPLESGYGQFINRNHFAFLMEMGFGLSLGMILGGVNKREQSLIYFAALLPMWTGLVLCGSRGGLIAMLAQVVAAALLFSLVFPRHHGIESESAIWRVVQSKFVRVILLLALIGGVVFGTVWLGGDPLANKIEASRQELTFETDPLRQGAGRHEIWQVTLRMFAAHPMLGIGMGAYWVAVPAFHDASGVLVPQAAHNDYLELLASGGVLGVALGLWFVFVVIRRTQKNLRSANLFHRAASFGAAIGIVGVAVHSLFDFGLHMIVNALVFTTLIVIATSNPQWAQGSHAGSPRGVVSPKTYE
jgi:O-antigen ligase